jgi:hypothetical protein
VSMVDKLLHQLQLRGLVVEYLGNDQLKLVGPKEQATPAVLATVKAFKRDLLERVRPRDYGAQASDVHHPPPTNADDGPETCEECQGRVWDRNGAGMMCDVRHCPMRVNRHG